MCCPNQVFLQLQGASAYQISSPTPKLVWSCYQIRKGFWSSSIIFKFLTISYLLPFFEVPQTFNPFSTFPPFTNIPHPFPSLSNKITQEETTKNSSPPSFSKPLLPLIFLVPWELKKSSPPNHGLFVLQWPMRIIMFTLQWILGW